MYVWSEGASAGGCDSVEMEMSSWGSVGEGRSPISSYLFIYLLYAMRLWYLGVLCATTLTGKYPRCVSVRAASPPAPRGRPGRSPEAATEFGSRLFTQTVYQEVAYRELRFLFPNVFPPVCPKLDQHVHGQSVPGPSSPAVFINYYRAAARGGADSVVSCAATDVRQMR